jgi:hypothetical protein
LLDKARPDLGHSPYHDVTLTVAADVSGTSILPRVRIAHKTRLSRAELLRLGMSILLLALAFGLSPLVSWLIAHQFAPPAVAGAFIYWYLPVRWLIPLFVAIVLARFSTARLIEGGLLASAYIVASFYLLDLVPMGRWLELVAPGFLLALIVTFGRGAVGGSWFARAAVITAAGNYLVAALPWLQIYAQVIGGRS